MLSSRNRTWAIVFLACAAILLLVLAFSLPGLELNPGKEVIQPLPEDGAGPLVMDLTDNLLILVRGMLALLVILLPFFILINLFSREGRRRVLGPMITLLMLFILMNLIKDNSNADLFQQTGMQATPVAATPEFLLEESPVPVETALASTPLSSPALDLGILLGIGAFLAGGIALLVWRLAQNTPATTLEKLAEEADAALGAIQAGDSTGDAILHCYEQMCQAVYEERAVERNTAMTPQEFIEILTRIGLPQGPVIRLTQLFEQVRYGSRQSTSLERADAIQCLTSIIQACKQTQTSAI